MKYKYIAKDDRIGIRKLQTDDVSQRYVEWLNDPAVNQYLECRHTEHTIESTSKYVASLDSNSELLLGIYDIKLNLHIGNIKIGPINRTHSQAVVGLLIGEKQYWGKGIGTDAIKLISIYASEVLNLETLSAGCYECNIGSYKAFIKSGWTKVGTINNYWVCSKETGERTGQIIMQYKKQKKIHIPKVSGITLIGGGELMKKLAEFLSQHSDVLVVTAKRHHDPQIESSLIKLGCEYHESRNINNDYKFDELAPKYSRICMCFGPAWIFSDKILALFENRIFNFNGIPLPRYIGGAHYTWQILNQSKEGGAYVQQITSNIDRGGVVAHKRYQLRGDVELPIDYETENIRQGYSFLKEFFVNLLEKESELELAHELIDWSEKRYFPRLFTSTNGWINWQWKSQEIISFCNAFGNPYGGASTTVNGKMRIFLKQLKLVNTEFFHPYCYGLIVNRVKGQSIYIASSGGLLVCEEFQFEKSEPTFEINVGDRLITPNSLIEKSMNRVSFSSEGVINRLDKSSQLE